MGSHPKQSQGGGMSQPAAAVKPAAPAHGDPLTWDPKTGNVKTWGPPPTPVAAAAPTPNLPSGRDAMAHMIALAASNNGRYMPMRNPNDMWGGSSAWMNGGR